MQVLPDFDGDISCISNVVPKVRVLVCARANSVSTVTSGAWSGLIGVSSGPTAMVFWPDKYLLLNNFQLKAHFQTPVSVWNNFLVSRWGFWSLYEAEIYLYVMLKYTYANHCDNKYTRLWKIPETAWGT